MKKALNWLLPLLILAFPFSGCTTESEEEDNATLSVVESTVTVPSTATEASFDIVSNSDWRVVCHSELVTSYTQSGSGNGTLKVAFEANTDTESEKSISLTVIAGKKSIALEIIQSRKGNDSTESYLTFVESAEVAAEETSYTLAIQSNSVWGVYTDAAWINSYTKMGEGDGQLVISFDQYQKRKEDREATFVISAQSVTKSFTLKQLRTTKIQIVDSKIGAFLLEEPDDEVSYRLLGVIESVSGASVTFYDYSGKVSVASVLDAPEGSPVDFASKGLAAGDAITLVGTRAVNGTEPTVGEAYLESSHKVTAVSVSEFIAKADGTETWYQVTGRVTAITNSMNGTLTMVDKTNASDVISIENVLTGVNGEAGKFESLFVSVDDLLTVIICGKSGATASEAWYVSSKGGKYPAGVLAQWCFSETADASLFTNWCGGVMDNSASVSMENKIGDTGQYVLSLDKKSKMKFTQVDKTGVGKWAALYLYSTGQPGFKEIWVGDAFEFDVYNALDIPEGTKIKMSFCLRIPTAGLGCYMLEYEADGIWYPIENDDHKISKVTLSGVEYSYNVQRTGNNVQTLQTYNFTINHAIPAESLKIRIRAAAPYSCGSAEMASPNGAARFRGIVSGTDLSPVIEVVE